VTQKGQTCDPNALRARYVENGWRLHSKVPPIENALWGIEWSRDQCRHMTPKGQTRDPNMLRAQYVENSWKCCLASRYNY